MNFLGLFDLDTVQRWLSESGYTWGTFIIFALLFSCGLGFPMPEDIPLIVGGFFVGQGKMNLALVSVLAWCGIIGGDCVLYFLSRRYGMGVTRLPMIRNHVTRERIIRTGHLFEKYGVWIVAIGRLFAGIRGAMVIAAGVTKFNFIKFFIADGLAALVSGGLFIALGYWAGKKVGNLGEFRQKIKPYEHWIMLSIAALVILYLAWRKRRHKTLSDVALEKVDSTPNPIRPEELGRPPIDGGETHS
jgi:membrane protein DedA with SNARE-associated domain